MYKVFKLNHELIRERGWSTSFGWEYIIISSFNGEDTESIVSSDHNLDFVTLDKDDFMEELCYGIYYLADFFDTVKEVKEFIYKGY